MVYLIIGNGYLTQSKVFQSPMFTTCLQLQTKLTSGSTRLIFGTSMSFLKFLYSCGAFSATVFLQKIISLRGKLFKQKQTSV